MDEYTYRKKTGNYIYGNISSDDFWMVGLLLIVIFGRVLF